MKKLEVYDPPMCCSSGVCGPNVNPKLVGFSSDLEWLKTQNVEVVRYGLSSHPAAFVKQELVKNALQKEGNECLPIIFANGVFVSKGGYPSREELGSFLEIKSNETLSVKGNEMKKSKNEVVCGPGCDCGKPSGNNKLKAVICVIVLLAVGSIFAYKAKNGKQTVPVDTASTFAAPIAAKVNEQKPAAPEAPAATAVTEKATVEPLAATQSVDKQEPVAVAAEEKKTVGETLDSLAALNTLAINQDTVLVLVPVKRSDAISKEITDAIASAEQKIKASGTKLGLYTLKLDSPDYANIAAQLPLPGMLVMTKGRGMGAVPAGITEDKILQAFVASSRVGGCGAGGCGPVGCN